MRRRPLGILLKINNYKSIAKDVMEICNYKDADFESLTHRLINRAEVDLESRDEAVREILKNVRVKGDEALVEYTNRFDQTAFGVDDLLVGQGEIEAAYKRIPQNEIEAMKLAAGNIEKFHQRQVQESWEYREDGVTLGQMVRPLATAGIYVPGGKASYPSSVLMNAVPARVAGVERIVMCSPAPGGEMSPHALVAADLAGVDMIFKVGGAQAVGAMAYGTGVVPRVDKIVGPGNIYVALAKRLVFGVVDIDMIAGPSEILIVADSSARADFVAADILSQAEHDEQAVTVLVTPNEELAEAVTLELEAQKKKLKRQEIMAASLADHCYLLVVEDLAAAVDLANRIAPEHLELAVAEPEQWAKKIRNAGAVFLGHFTPEAVGDYLAGPNHVLPTSGTARFSSPLGVYDFIKRTSLISYSPEALGKVADACRTLAEMENLDAHANAVKIRASVENAR